MKKRFLAAITALCTIFSCVPYVNAQLPEDERISENYVRIFSDALNNKILKDKSYRTCNIINLTTADGSGGYYTGKQSFDKSDFSDAYILDYDNDNQPELIVAFSDFGGSFAIIYEYDQENEKVYLDKAYTIYLGGTGEGGDTSIYYSKELGFYIAYSQYARFYDRDAGGTVGNTNFNFVRFKNGEREELLNLKIDYDPIKATEYNDYSENTSEGNNLKAKFEELKSEDRLVIIDAYDKGKNLTKYYIPPIKVILNGSEVGFDVYPEILSDRTFVPVRKICEAMGYNVEWNQDTLSATISRKNILMTVQLNNNEIEVQNLNGVKRRYKSDVAPRTINDRILIPVRAVCECLGCEVNWDGENRIVYINYDPYPLEHISFTGNSDYLTHKKNGGMAGEVKDRYVKSWGIDVAHFLWDFVTVAKDVATIDAKGLVNDIIKRDDLQYELILNEMLMSTAIEKSYAEIFEEEYYDIILPLLDIAAFAEADADEGDILKSESKVRAEIREAANKGHADNMALQTAIAAYVDFAAKQGGGKTLAELFKLAEGSADYNKIISKASAVSDVSDVVEIINRTYSNFTEAVNSVAVAMACAAADERFITVVEEIRDYVNSGLEYGKFTTDNKNFAKGFSKAVDNYIEEFKFNRENRELAILKKVSDEGLSVTANLGADIARLTITSGMWSGELYSTISTIFPDKLPIPEGTYLQWLNVLAGINLGFDKGVSLADAIFDTTGTEYNQKYLMKLGVIAQATSLYLDKLTDNLKTHERQDPLSVQTREDAELLHCALNVYKAIQISGLDKAKKIEEAKGWFKNNDTLEQINKWNNTLMSLDCH